MLYVICGNIEPASLTSTNWVYVGLFNMVSNCLMKNLVVQINKLQKIVLKKHPK